VIVLVHSKTLDVKLAMVFFWFVNLDEFVDGMCPCCLLRDDDYEDEVTPRRRSKKDISLDDIDDVGTPKSATGTACSIPDS